MKKLLIVLLALFLIVPLAIAKEVKIEFQWTANTEPNIVQYNVYHRVEGQDYDYTILIGTAIHPATTLQVPFNVPEGQLIKNYFVIRAEDSEQDQSGDSAEVWVSVDTSVPPAPVITAGVYNNVAQTVDLSWDQTDPVKIAKWKLFKSDVSGGPYTEISEIVNNGSTDYSTSWPIPSDGTYYFTIVGYTVESEVFNAEHTTLEIVEEVFTPDSNQMEVQVKEHPSPTKEFKIKIRIR